MRNIMTHKKNEAVNKLGFLHHQKQNQRANWLENYTKKVW